MMFALVPFVLCLTAAAAAEPTAVEYGAFESFKTKFEKVYEDFAGESKAFSAFRASLERIAKRNEEEGNTVAGLTKFSDLTPEEFRATYLARGGVPSHAVLKAFNSSACTAATRFPELCDTKTDDFDWTTQGAVTQVKDQGQCGSCWSFGTTGDIEGVHFLAGNDLVSLSEQQLVSCDTTSNEGCNGGLQEDAFDYVIKTGGLVLEKTYPYTSGAGRSGTCKSSKISNFAASISSWSQVSKSAAGEAGIIDALTKNGPITIGINASPMQEYTSGIDNPRLCSARSLDHAVLIVGYGTENGVDYWKIKNSWASDWGEDGYYRIVRGVNKCGVAMDAVHSSV